VKLEIAVWLIREGAATRVNSNMLLLFSCRVVSCQSYRKGEGRQSGCERGWSRVESVVEDISGQIGQRGAGKDRIVLIGWVEWCERLLLGSFGGGNKSRWIYGIPMCAAS
jgi:hypothetical protein